MINNKRVIAIIPARGGSKRLPHKNILPCAGKPLINWTINAAQQSRIIDTVVVSSDHSDILAVSAACGAEIIKRPCNLAEDASSLVSALAHTLDTYNDYDYLLLLQATSPLRTTRHIEQGINDFFTEQAYSVVSVSKAHPRPDCLYYQSAEGFLQESGEGHRVALNGAFCFLSTHDFLASGKLIDERTIGYIMPLHDSVDINTQLDFDLAEQRLKTHYAQ